MNCLMPDCGLVRDVNVMLRWTKQPSRKFSGDDYQFEYAAKRMKVGKDCVFDSLLFRRGERQHARWLSSLKEWRSILAWYGLNVWTIDLKRSRRCPLDYEGELIKPASKRFFCRAWSPHLSSVKPMSVLRYNFFVIHRRRSEPFGWVHVSAFLAIHTLWPSAVTETKKLGKSCRIYCRSLRASGGLFV